MLFPELAQSGLIGIARHAAESEMLEGKRRVEYRQLATRRYIGRASGVNKHFEWTINPYRGCEFGCKYCYARYTHEFMELHESEQFERLIFAKEFYPRRFKDELRRIPLRDSIAVGTATDPYQPAERRFGITREMLEIFAGERLRTLSVTTKSDLAGRDSDLLGRIATCNTLHIFMTITTTDLRLARVLEPYAPRPDLRFKAVRKLTAEGVRVTVQCSPMMPLINDSAESISAVAQQASAAGATYLSAGVLFLKPCAQKAFFPMLEEHFPHLVRRYRERYEKQAYLRGSYNETIAERVKEIREHYGLVQKPAFPRAVSDDSQMVLFTI